ncbi:MAG TPA: hypothetical protein VEA69_19495 [Tepidisphaeraceae bacterium]|nr:hypothetical protein [Tepidisphaeraceae bacterium]
MSSNKNTRQSRAGNTKKKATARQNATQRMDTVDRRGERGKSTAGSKTNPSTQSMSQQRFPGETPLTGEDRPANRQGGKKGQGSSRKTRA